MVTAGWQVVCDCCGFSSTCSNRHLAALVARTHRRRTDHAVSVEDA